MGKASRRKQERRAAPPRDPHARAREVAEAGQGAALEGAGLWGGLSNGRAFAWVEHETKRDTLLRRTGVNGDGPPATPHGLPLLTRVWLPRGRKA
jgi:hypothetical protein